MDMVTPVHTETVYDENDCPDPVPSKISKPVKDSTISTIYEWSGWSTGRYSRRAYSSPQRWSDNTACLQSRRAQRKSAAR